jgi:excisionase family DNA binding protein
MLLLAFIPCSFSRPSAAFHATPVTALNVGASNQTQVEEVRASAAFSLQAYSPARILGISPNTIQQMISRGVITGKKIGGKLHITNEDLEALKETATAPKPGARIPRARSNSVNSIVT